jgi:hypothetical protein
MRFMRSMRGGFTRAVRGVKQSTDANYLSTVVGKTQTCLDTSFVLRNLQGGISGLFSQQSGSEFYVTWILPLTLRECILF